MRRPSEERQWEQEMNLVLMPGEIEDCQTASTAVV